jgi:hypothetical protein
VPLRASLERSSITALLSEYCSESIEPEFGV